MVKSGNFVGVVAGVAGLLVAIVLSMGLPLERAGALVAGEGFSEQQDDTVQVGTAPRYLADGAYVLDVGKSQSMMVDVAKSSMKAGAKVVMANDSASKSQQWVFSWDDQFEAYRIKNARSGFYLTTKDAKAGEKLVSQAKYYETNRRQLWTLERHGAGYIILSLANSSVGLGTADAKAKVGAYITTQSAKTKKFKFYLLPVNRSLMKPASEPPENLNGSFVNITASSSRNLMIGIKSDSTSDNATAALMKKSGSNSQKWYLKLVNANEGVYSIVNLGSGKALQIADKGRHIGCDVVQGSVKSSNAAQQWWVRSSGEGYTFTSCYNGLVLHSADAKANANVNMAIGGASNCSFNLKSVVPLDSGFYRVFAQRKESLTWGVAEGSEKQNKQLQVSAFQDGVLWQKFKLEDQGDGIYSIRSVTSNRYVGQSGRKVVQGTRTPSASQQWKVVWKGSGFALQNVATNDYLCVSGTVKSGAKLATSSKYRASTSMLAFTKCRLIEDGTYFLSEGGNAKKVMGISQADAFKEKASLGIFSKANVQGYKFGVRYVGKGSAGDEIYEIRNIYSGKYLTASGNSLFQKGNSNSNSQRWMARVCERGMLGFVNVATKKAISFGSKKLKTVKYRANDTHLRWNLQATTSLTPEQLRAYEMLTATFSNTNYAITTDLTNHRVRVWKRSSKSDPWTLKYDWICSNGSRLTPTPAVNVLSSGRKRFENPPTRPDGTIYGSSFWYMTYIASGKYFHTPLYKKGSMTRYADARMGRFISHGCVRLHTPNAIWIYKNIKKGTRIITYY